MTAFFRGRKLRGKLIKVRGGYRGVVMSSTDRQLVQHGKSGPSDNFISVGGGNFDVEGEEDEEMTEETKVLEEHAPFDEIVVWDHETLSDASDDAYLKGMDEWIAFAEQVGHGIP